MPQPACTRPRSASPTTTAAEAAPPEVTATGNDRPSAVDETTTTAEDTPVDIAVLDNDTDTATPNDQLASRPSERRARDDEMVGRQVHYTPTADRCGTDTFTYDVSDGELTATAFVTVEITCVPDAPVANAGGDRALLEGSSQTLFASRSDVDGDTPLTAAWTPATGLEDASVLQPTVLAADDSVTDYTLTVCDPTGVRHRHRQRGGGQRRPGRSRPWPGSLPRHPSPWSCRSSMPAASTATPQPWTGATAPVRWRSVP